MKKELKVFIIRPQDVRIIDSCKVTSAKSHADRDMWTGRTSFSNAYSLYAPEGKLKVIDNGIDYDFLSVSTDQEISKEELCSHITRFRWMEQFVGRDGTGNHFAEYYGWALEKSFLSGFMVQGIIKESEEHEK